MHKYKSTRTKRALMSLTFGFLMIAGVQASSIAPASAEVAKTPGATAVEYAQAQVGKPYQYGAAGPGAFDCSGLVMQAYAAAGKALPRMANEQAATGVRVPLADAQPGDIVSWAGNPGNTNTVYHVGLYVGDNTAVMASRSGTLVKVRDMWSSGLVPYATRP